MSSPSELRPLPVDAQPLPTAEDTRTRRRRRLIVVGAVAVLLAGGGAAYAYWTSTGQGDSTADTGTAPIFTVTATPGTGGPLTPGGPTETIDFSVGNTSTGALHLQNVTAQVGNTDGTPWNVGNCTADDFTVGTPAIVYGDIAPGGTADGTVTVAMINRTVNQNDCQGVSVPVHFVAS